MTTSLRSEELNQLLAKIYQKGATGFVSITVQDGARPSYGTLQVSEGQLLSAQFKNLTGRSALEQIGTLEFPSISFARSNVTAPRDADIPEMSDVIDLSQVPAARVRTKAKATKAAKPNTAEKNTRGFGIFPRVLATVLIAALLPLSGLWAFNYLTIQQEVVAGIEETLGQTSDLITSQVNDWVNVSVTSSNQISQLININEAEQSPSNRNPILVAATESIPWNYGATLANASGQQIGRSDGSDLTNIGDREYFQQAFSGIPVGHQVIMSRASGKPAICLSVPHQQDGTTAGVVYQCGNLDNVADFLGAPQIGASSTLFITDAKNRLVAHSSLELPTEDFLDFSSHPAVAANTQEVVNYTTDDTDKVAYVQKTDLGWNVVVEKTRAEAFSELRRVERQTIALFIVALILVLTASYLLSRRFVKPIQNLTEVAEAISLGNLGVGIEGKDRGDELGSLARAIERLRVSVKVMFTELRSQQQDS